MEKPPIELTPADAQRFVDRIEPALSVADVTVLLGGAISSVFEVRCSDDRRIVVKVYSDVFHWKLEKEVFVYGLLRDRGVDAPVAQVLLGDDSKSVVPYNVLALTKLEGTLASDLDSVGEDLYRQIGALLRSLHAVTFDEFGYVATHGIYAGHPTNGDYMRPRFAQKRRGFEELGGDAALARRLRAHVAEREHLLDGCERAVLCHDDRHGLGNTEDLPGLEDDLRRLTSG